MDKRCGSCQWLMPDCELNRKLYSNLPICGFALGPNGGKHVELTDLCNRWTMPFHKQEPLTWHHDPGSTDLALQKGYYA